MTQDPYWQFLLAMWTVVLLSPFMYLAAYAFFFATMGAVEFLVRKMFPDPPPFCDIDPRCHPAFLWGPDGNGYIGALIVVRRNG